MNDWKVEAADQPVLMGNSAKQTLGQIEMTEYMLVMKTPQFLYRFRPLKSGKILEREIEALRDSYLFAPAFSEMNDPMEAYYETGGPGDSAVNNMIPGATDFSAQLTIDGDTFNVSGTGKPDPFIDFMVDIVDFGAATFFQFTWTAPMIGGPYGKAITELN